MENHRLIVVPVVRDEASRLLLCKMSPDRGVFPGQWALPGGGVEAGETILEALTREVRVELGVEVVRSRPLFFKDFRHEKTFPDGEKRPIYMVFLIFECRVDSPNLSLTQEFSSYAWVRPGRFDEYDMNSITRDTLDELGLL